MTNHVGNESESEDDEDIGIGEGFQSHLDALKRACLLNIGLDSFGTTRAGSISDTSSSVLEEDDEELFESIQKKYSAGSYLEKDLLERRPVTVSDDEDDDEDDEEILRSVEKLYGAKEPSKLSQRKEKVHEPEDFPEADTIFPEWEAPEEISNEDGNSSGAFARPSKDLGRAVSTMLPSNWNDEEDPEFVPPNLLSALVPFGTCKQSTSLLSSAEYGKLDSAEKEEVIAEALQKNLSCQEKMRTILSRIESKQKHNAEMQRRVRTLLDFERYCRRRYAGFFTDQANPSLKLFSVRGEKREASDKNEYSSTGPPDNPDVEAYKNLKQKAMFASISRKWRVDEKRELAKGVKQQVYEVLVCEVMDEISNGCVAGDNALDDALNEIRNKDITPQDMRNAIGAVNWDEISRVYVVNRTPEECRTRWLNHEDPLINKSPWTKIEDKKLLSIAQRYNTTNWEKIAQELGTKRTPAECLMRYQRSLNASIMRSNWTPEEDAKLRAAVEELGESDWSAVAACLEGRNNSQCLMRWYKVLHPARNRKGRWSVEEDKRLQWAVSVYGAKKWKQIAEHVPGRTDIQCRERWCNVLNPDIKVDVWTEEEDTILRESIARHGPHRWSAISADLKCRTDKQCWRRWKILFPEHQSDYQRNVFIQRNALVKNFQGRKKERPKLGPQDFVSRPENFPILSNKTKQKATKGPSAKESSVQGRIDGSAGNRSASNQRGSDRGVRGARQEVPLNVDDALSAVSDPKLRRLARIHKLKLARASKGTMNVVRKVRPAGARVNASTSDELSVNGREQAADLGSSVQVRTDTGKKRPGLTSSYAQGKAKGRRLKPARKNRLDTVRRDTGSAAETSQVPETISIPGDSEPLAVAVISSVTNGPADVVNDCSTSEKMRSRSRKHSRVEACYDQGQPTKRAKASKCLSRSGVPGESEVQTAPEEQQMVGPGPEVLAFVDLVSAVNDFCKYSSHVYEEQAVSAFSGSEVSNMELAISAEDASGRRSSTAGIRCSNFLLEKYPRSGQDHRQPTAGTDCVSASGEGSGAGTRMVPTIATSGGVCNSLWCANLGVNRTPVCSDRTSDAIATTGSGTGATVGGEGENPANPRRRLSIEDEEVEAATQAILSWPFFYGVQQLMHQASEFLDAKPSRKKPAAGSSSKSQRKGVSLDVNAASQLPEIRQVGTGALDVNAASQLAEIEQPAARSSKIKKKGKSLDVNAASQLPEIEQPHAGSYKTRKKVNNLNGRAVSQLAEIEQPTCGSSGNRKRKYVDVNEDSQLEEIEHPVRVNSCPVPRQPRRTGTVAKRRRVPGRTDHHVDMSE